jgi:hypothetical protein
MVRSFKQTGKDTLVEIFKLNATQYSHTRYINDCVEYAENYSDTYLTLEHDAKIVGGADYYIKEGDKSGRKLPIRKKNYSIDISDGWMNKILPE